MDPVLPLDIQRVGGEVGPGRALYIRSGAWPNKGSELTAHRVGFLSTPGVVPCGPPLTGSVRLLASFGVRAYGEEKDWEATATLFVHSESVCRCASQQVPSVPETHVSAEIRPLYPHRRVGADGAR